MTVVISCCEPRYQMFFYICQECGPVDGQQNNSSTGHVESVRQDSSCCGNTDAGYVHLSCLVTSAKTQNQNWEQRSLTEFCRPWKICPKCNEPYQNQFALDIASKFVLSIKETKETCTAMLQCFKQRHRV